jgi:lactoylglutathione lyase
VKIFINASRNAALKEIAGNCVENKKYINYNNNMKLIHSAIRTRDLNKSLDFYVKVFGFAVREKRYIEAHKTTLVFLKSRNADFEIELIADDNPKPLNDCENSFAHLAFQSENIDEDAKKIKEAGVTFSREPFLSMDKSMKIAFLNDPDGIIIEIIEYLKK